MTPAAKAQSTRFLRLQQALHARQSQQAQAAEQHQAQALGKDGRYGDCVFRPLPRPSASSPSRQLRLPGLAAADTVGPRLWPAAPREERDMPKVREPDLPSGSMVNGRVAVVDDQGRRHGERGGERHGQEPDNGGQRGGGADGGSGNSTGGEERGQGGDRNGAGRDGGGGDRHGRGDGQQSVGHGAVAAGSRAPPGAPITAGRADGVPLAGSASPDESMFQEPLARVGAVGLVGTLVASSSRRSEIGELPVDALHLELLASFIESGEASDALRTLALVKLHLLESPRSVPSSPLGATPVRDRMALLPLKLLIASRPRTPEQQAIAVDRLRMAARAVSYQRRGVVDEGAR